MRLFPVELAMGPKGPTAGRRAVQMRLFPVELAMEVVRHRHWMALKIG